MFRRLTWAMMLALGLALSACTSLTAAEEEGDDEQETTIKFADAPKAVQDTFKKEAKGAKIETLTKEVEGGKTVYEAEVTVDGKAWEIEVAEDGTLLEKESADGDDDDDDDADDDDDDKQQESGRQTEKK